MCRHVGARRSAASLLLGGPEPPKARLNRRSDEPCSPPQVSGIFTDKARRPRSTSLDATPQRRSWMKKALRQLISALDRVSAEHAEVGDPAVREFMYDVVHKAFIAPQRGYDLPDEFGM